MACSLRSPEVNPVHRYYEAVRPWPAHWYFRPRGASTCAFSLSIAVQVLKFRTKARIRVTAPVHRTSPAADFCHMVRVNLSTLSHDSVTCSRSPQVSSTAFHAQPPDLPPVPWMDVGFAILCSLLRHRRPPIQFLFIGSRVCSTLLSDLASRLGPCASLILHLLQVG